MTTHLLALAGLGLLALAAAALLNARYFSEAAWADDAPAPPHGPEATDAYPALSPQWPSAATLARWRRWTLLLVPLGAVALAAWHGPGAWFAWGMSALLLALLWGLALIDLATATVELDLVFGGILLRLAALGLYQPALLVEAVGGMLAGAGLFCLVALAYQHYRGRPGLGEGDAAVMGLLGAFVGWEGIFAVVLLAAVLGLAIGLPWLLATRRGTDVPLPLVPFLAVAGLLVYEAQAAGFSLWHHGLGWLGLP